MTDQIDPPMSHPILTEHLVGVIRGSVVSLGALVVQDFESFGATPFGNNRQIRPRGDAPGAPLSMTGSLPFGTLGG